MRSRRWSRWLIVGVVLAVGLIVTIDVVALQVFESRGSAQIARGMAAEQARLELGGAPVLLEHLRGRYDAVEITVVGASGGGMRVDRISLSMQDAEIPAGKFRALLRSRHATTTEVTGSSVIGRATFAAPDLLEFLSSADPDVADVRIDSTGVLVTFGLDPDDPESAAVARFLPGVEDRRVVLRLLGASDLPRDLVDDARALEQVIGLPRVPEGLRTDVTLGNGVFEIEASGPTVTFSIGEGTQEAAGGSPMRQTKKPR